MRVPRATILAAGAGALPAIFLLGLLTQCVIGMEFLERASANISGIAVFSLAAVTRY